MAKRQRREPAAEANGPSTDHPDVTEPRIATLAGSLDKLTPVPPIAAKAEVDWPEDIAAALATVSRKLDEK